MFKAGKHTEALQAYLIALTYVDEDFMFQLEGHFLDQAEAVKAPVLLNMAACQLHLEDYTTAAHNCTEVLALMSAAKGPDLQKKALFRRAKARKGLGQTDEALKDLLTLLLMCAPLGLHALLCVLGVCWALMHRLDGSCCLPVRARDLEFLPPV